MNILKWIALGIFLVLIWLFRRTIIAAVKKVARTLNDLDKKGSERFSINKALAEGK